MSISATYVSATSFTVSGDRTGYLMPTCRIQATMGVDGVVEGSVASVTYNSGPDTTTVVINESVLTSNLATIKYQVIFADYSSSSANLPEHVHLDTFSGGAMDAASLSSAEIAMLQSIPIPSGGDALKFLRVNSGETGYEAVDIIGSSNQLLGVNSGGTDLESKTI